MLPAFRNQALRIGRHLKSRWPQPARQVLQRVFRARSAILGVGVASAFAASASAFLVANAEAPEVSSPKENGENKTQRQHKAPQKIPLDEGKDTMVEHYDFVVVGGGVTGASAVAELAKKGEGQTICFISEEAVHPYDRAYLTKGVWIDDSFTTDTFGFPLNYSDGNIYLYLNTKVNDIHSSKRLLQLSDGNVISYGKCLLATGSSPKPLAVPHPVSDKIHTYHTIQDFENLRKAVDDPNVKNIVVIGDSPHSAELVCGLAYRSHIKKKNLNITYLIPQYGIMSQYLPEYLSEELTGVVASVGVKIITNAQVVSIDDNLSVHLSSGEPIKSDHVVVSLGTTPNTSIGDGDKLEIDPYNGGFATNSQLKIKAGLWAAGDIASYYDPILGRKRLTCVENSEASGIQAARNMIGPSKNYFTWPVFDANIMAQHVRALGIVDPSLETISVWEKGADGKPQEFKRGIIYYMQDQKVRGVVLYNFRETHVVQAAYDVLQRTERNYESPSDLVRAIPWEKIERFDEKANSK